LILNKEIINDNPNNRLFDYNIDDDTIIKLRSKDLMQIFIKWIDGKTFTISIGEYDTVKDLCLLINHRKEEHSMKYRILYGSKIITYNLDSYISSYGITNDSTLFAYSSW
jgi:hypothetical protein